jgi:phage/plasmid-like protein (TIGR03299 family)
MNQHIYHVPKSQIGTALMPDPLTGVAADVRGSMTSEEVMKNARLDWQVAKTPIQLNDGTPVESHVAIVRQDNRRILGITGEGYEPLQNAEAFSFTDTLVEMGAMEYIGAGLFDDGRRIFIQGRINKPEDDNGPSMGPTEIVPGDIIDPLFFVGNGHDGSLALRCNQVTQEVICRNTFAIALGQAKENPNCITIRHTKNMVERLEKARELLIWAGTSFHKTIEATRVLAKKSMTAQRAEELFKEAFKIKPPEGKEILSPQAENKLGRLMALFETGVGNDLPGVEGTSWAAVRAVTQYLTHEAASVVRGGKDLSESAKAAQIAMKRYESNILGNNRVVAERAFNLALAA